MKNILLLGSKSVSRKMLLERAQIPFTIIAQDSDEVVCNNGLSFSMLVSQIAREKMNHVVLLEGTQEDTCFVLTVDTMVQDIYGATHGKPIDKDDAIAKLKLAAKGFFVCTAICLDRKVRKNGQWEVCDRIEEVVHAEYVFSVPEHRIVEYMEKVPVFSIAGATSVEGFGSQFLQSVTGSYSTIVGLPMYELSHALGRIGFFN